LSKANAFYGELVEILWDRIAIKSSNPFRGTSQALLNGPPPPSAQLANRKDNRSILPRLFQEKPHFVTGASGLICGYPIQDLLDSGYQ
jgi:hypothetical protein